MTGGGSRALVAAGLLAALTGALLIAWFASGWADVRARQRTVREAPRLAAEQRGAELAHELRSELSGLLAREIERPYFHYQNLFHDPLASAGQSVTPSPLVASRDALVLGYFQLDAHARATTPTINDELPELSEPKRLADNRRFRDEVARSLASALPPRGAGPMVAALTAPPSWHATTPAPTPQRPARPATAAAGDSAAPPPPAQVVAIQPSIYFQNAAPNAIYEQQRDALSAGGAQRDNGSARVDARGADGAPAAPAPVAITVSPLEWRTQPFAGQPAMVAVRQVETPDGPLAQGFVVDRTALTGWLAGHAGDAVAELRTGDNGTTEIVPGWHLEVAPNPRALAAAAADASSVAHSFVARFVAVGAIALVAALLVVMLVARAERLARERSQFAAAAAHELRTPLAGLQLYGDMLADGLGDPSKLRDYARRMSEEAARLGRVVSNVLGFSQLERGNLSVDARPGALGEVLCELADRARPALERAGAALAVDVGPALAARFDRDALARIVGNLLDNAEKYSRLSADRTIGLTARAAGPVVEVAVSDRGPGIAPHARARLFRPFVRGVPTDGPAGLGLGLALSQSLARAMGGDLLHSVGRAGDAGGAVFVLTLPAA